MQLTIAASAIIAASASTPSVSANGVAAANTIHESNRVGSIRRRAAKNQDRNSGDECTPFANRINARRNSPDVGVLSCNVGEICINDSASSIGGRCVAVSGDNTEAALTLGSSKHRELDECTKCVGLYACDGIVDRSKIGCGSCNGFGACVDLASDVTVGTNSCNGDLGCVGLQVSVGNNSCHDYKACYKVEGDDVPNNACIGNNMCQYHYDAIVSAPTGAPTGSGAPTSSISPTSAPIKSVAPTVECIKCTGISACNNVDQSKIGCGSCNGFGACVNLASDVTVGTNSCNGEFSCVGLRVPVGNNSCHGYNSCYNAQGVPDNVCIGDNMCLFQFSAFAYPTGAPTGSPVTSSPIAAPTGSPVTSSPTTAPTGSPNTSSPTSAPTKAPTTAEPTAAPSSSPSEAPATTANSSVGSDETADADISNLCPLMASKVKVQSLTGLPIEMREVRVLSSGGVNIAIGKSATQSSDLNHSSIASKAVDGEWRSWSSTGTDTSSTWWELDLGEEPFPVEKVIIVNRKCNDDSNCSCNLSHAAVFLYDGQGKVVSSTTTKDTCGKGWIVRNFVSSAYCI